MKNLVALAPVLGEFLRPVFRLVIINQCDHVNAGQIISDQGGGVELRIGFFWLVFKNELIHAIVTSTVCVSRYTSSDKLPYLITRPYYGVYEVRMVFNVSLRGLDVGRCPELNPTPVCKEDIAGCQLDDECAPGQTCCLQKDCTRACLAAKAIPPPRM